MYFVLLIGTSSFKSTFWKTSDLILQNNSPAPHQSTKGMLTALDSVQIWCNLGDYVV